MGKCARLYPLPNCQSYFWRERYSEIQDLRRLNDETVGQWNDVASISVMRLSVDDSPAPEPKNHKMN